MQIAAAFNNIVSFYSTNVDTSSNGDYLGTGNVFGRKKMKRFFRNSPILPFIIVGLVILGVLIFSWNNIFGSSSATTPVSGRNDKRVEVAAPKSQQVLNRTFEFPLKDQTGKEVSKLRYEIQNIELRDEIIVKGEKASAIKGRTFLIVNIKITNNFDKSIQVNVRDYLRLIINNSSDKLAPDIHNDPVDVQAISTKLTRVGFPINDTDTNLTLQVGEITGPKQTIKISFQ